MEDYTTLLPDFLRNMDPELYLSDNFIVLDLETTTQGDCRSPDAIFPQNSIVCAAWIHADDEPGDEKFVYGNEYEMFELIQDSYDVDYVVAQNGKFDIKWLIRAGMDPSKILLADTMLAEYVLTGNLKAGGKNGGLSLDAICKERYGEGKDPYVAKLMKNGVCPSEIPRSDLEKRNRKDIYQTRQLWLDQREELFDQDVAHLFYVRCLLSPVLADIELRGVHLDRDAVLKEHKAVSDKMAEVTRGLDLMLEGRNPRSVPQMQEFIYDVLKFKPLKKGGVEWRPTGEQVLDFKAKTKKQEKFLSLKKDFAQFNAGLSKNLDYFKGVVEEKGCIFYAQFNQAQTVTHRLSSSGIKATFDMFSKPKSIQLQNSPRKYKPMYTARTPGWYTIETDGAQIEFRVAGFIGQDVQICQDIVDGVDVHSFTASVLNNCSVEDVAEQKKTAPKGADWRTLAKADTFKPLKIAAYSGNRVWKNLVNSGEA